MPIEDIVVSATTAITAAESLSQLQQIKVKYLGRAGQLTLALRQIGQAPPAQR